MERLKITDIENLKPGETVLKISGIHFVEMVFISKHPNSDRSFVFCKDDSFDILLLDMGMYNIAKDWFIGEFDREQAVKILTDRLKEQIERVKKLYS